MPLYSLSGRVERFTIQVSEVKQNVPVDKAKFVKPAAEEPKVPGK
jgi:hypothetical protein